MTRASTLVGSGIAPASAQAIVGFSTVGATATGSTSQANSLLIQNSNTFVSTTASATGVRLPSGASPGDTFFVYNGGAETLFVYPPTGGNISGGSANAKVDVATLLSATFKVASADGLTFAHILSA